MTILKYSPTHLHPTLHLFTHHSHPNLPPLLVTHYNNRLHTPHTHPPRPTFLLTHHTRNSLHHPPVHPPTDVPRSTFLVTHLPPSSSSPSPLSSIPTSPICSPTYSPFTCSSPTFPFIIHLLTHLPHLHPTVTNPPHIPPLVTHLPN